MTKPQNELEAALETIWRESMGLDEIGCDENFFDLGGHSLIGIEIVTRIRADLGLPCALPDLTLHPTITELANSIAASIASRLTPQLAAQFEEA